MQVTAARLLWQARVNGNALPRDFEGHPESESDAYAIQAALIEASGSSLAGWKLGATNQPTIELLGVNDTFVGPVFERFCYESGADVPIAPAQSPGLETEFTVRLGADLPYRQAPYSRADIEPVVASVCPSFEIVATRFEGSPVGAGPLLVADGGANAATVLGAPVTDWRSFDLRDHPLTLSVNGAQVAEGSNAVLRWDHTFDAVAWLASHATIAERGLLAGDLIMTGTCTGLAPLHPGDEAVADFGAMGEVRARFR